MDRDFWKSSHLVDVRTKDAIITAQSAALELARKALIDLKTIFDAPATMPTKDPDSVINGALAAINTLKIQEEA